MLPDGPNGVPVELHPLDGVSGEAPPQELLCIFGTGDFGRSLGQRLLHSGYRVVYGSRRPGSSGPVPHGAQVRRRSFEPPPPKPPPPALTSEQFHGGPPLELTAGGGVGGVTLLSAFRGLAVQQTRQGYYLERLCVLVCARACVRARLCVRSCVRVCVCVCVLVSVLLKTQLLFYLHFCVTQVRKGNSSATSAYKVPRARVCVSRR